MRINYYFMNKIILCLTVLLVPTLSLYFELTTDFCIDTNEIPQEKYHLYVQANSDEADQPTVILSIVDKHLGTIISEEVSHKTMELDASIEKNICFKNPGTGKRYVLIDLWTSSANKIKQLAVKGQIEELHSEMHYLSQGIRNISRGQKFQEQRQNLHSSIILNYQNKIKWLGTTKILFIIGLVVAQILILRHILSKREGFMI